MTAEGSALLARMRSSYVYPPERDPSMDSLRFLAVVLIVLFHFLSNVRSPGGLIDGVYFATWAVRMPLLVFVAGWFSSAEPPTKRSITRLLQSIVVVYVVFDLLQRLQIYLLRANDRLQADDPLFNFDRPIFGMWFLLMLAIQRILLPYIVRVRWFGLLAVLGALAIGFTGADRSFALSRTFVLLPIFLLGWYARQSGLRDRLASWPARVAAALVLLCSLATGWLLNGTIDRRLVGMDAGYRGAETIELGWRALFLFWAAATAIAMLALVPKRRIPVVSACGAGSMYAYILHQFVHRHWASTGGPELVSGHLGIALLAVAVLTLAVVLMLPGFRRFFRPLVQPRWEWFLRDREPISDVTPRR